MSADKIIASYQLPADSNTEKRAQMIAIGQTTGSWGAQYAGYDEIMSRYTGEIVDITPLDEQYACARISFPLHNTENDIPSLLTCIFGKFSLAGPSRLLDIQLPDGFGTRPAFGINGIKDLCNVHDRPLFMGIFKPALGLAPADYTKLLDSVAQAGLDLIKDDEIMFNLASAPTLERVKACRPIIQNVAETQGRQMLYAVNLSGRADKLIDNARRLIDAGANAILLNVLAYGFSCLEALAAHADINIPIFTHPALAGAIGGPTSGSSDYGIDYAVLLGTLMKHAGADAVLFPASYGSLPFDVNTESRLRKILTSTEQGQTAVMPVPSAGIQPGITRIAYNDYGNDVILNAGSAIFDHPMGASAGVRSFHDAWELARHGKAITLENAETDALKTALEKWGEEK